MPDASNGDRHRPVEVRAERHVVRARRPRPRGRWSGRSTRRPRHRQPSARTRCRRCRPSRRCHAAGRRSGSGRCRRRRGRRCGRRRPAASRSRGRRRSSPPRHGRRRRVMPPPLQLRDELAAGRRQPALRDAVGRAGERVVEEVGEPDHPIAGRVEPRRRSGVALERVGALERRAAPATSVGSPARRPRNVVEIRGACGSATAGRPDRPLAARTPAGLVLGPGEQAPPASRSASPGRARRA